VDLIVSPTVVAFNTQSGAHPQVLTPGQTIDALVMQLIDATTVRVSVAGTVVDLPTQIPLVPGAIVRLAVRGHGTDTKFVIVGTSPRSPTEAGQKPAPDAVTSVTIADHAPVGAGVAADDTALTSVTPEQAPVAPVAKSVDRVVTADPTAALASAMRTSAARQVGLAPLLADAAEVSVVPQLPAPVRQALTQLLALPQSFESRASAADIRQSLKQSGVLMEAHLADPRAPYTPAPDLKVALLALRHVLHDWVERVPQLPASTAAETASAAAAAALATIKSAVSMAASAPAAHTVPGAPATGHDAESASPMAVAAVKAPPPPYRGAPTTGQGPVEASIEATASLEAIRNTLVERTEGALARMTLLQSASLGDSAGPQQARHESSPHWNFEVPFMVPAGNAVAHFEIARDGHKGTAKDAKGPVWRANFSLNLEPIGPVHAQIAVAGNRASVRLWAERGASAAALRAGTTVLKQALHEAHLESTEVLVRDGVPPRPVKPPAGRFLDRAS
jgi:hypothetical protein